MLNLSEKLCTKCNQLKLITEFGKEKRTESGFSYWCKICRRMYRKLYRQENKEYFKEKDFSSDLKKHYGITADQYWQMFKDQNGLCACCNQSADKFKRRFHVDHDHTTGAIRGLLCTECNPGIGYFKDSVLRLEQAITYLKKFKKLG